MKNLVLDPCCGSKMFYFNHDDERVLFGDCRTFEGEIYPGRFLRVAPDQLLDFRSLPAEWENKFPLVVFDPPHLLRAGQKSYMRAKYGVLDKENWRDDLRKGFSECFRCLAPNGTLIFKWSEVQIPLREVLALTPEKPLFGNKKPAQTGGHWIVFMKETNQ